MIQSGGSLGWLLGPLLEITLPLMKNVIKPLAKSVLNPLGLTKAASAADAGIHKKILGSDKHPSGSASNDNTIAITSNDEMKDIIEIVKSLENSGLWFKGVSETFQSEAKEQREEILSMLLGTLGACILGDILTGRWINRTGEGIVRAGYGNKRKDFENKNGFLIAPHPLTNVEIQKYN